MIINTDNTDKDILKFYADLIKGDFDIKGNEVIYESIYENSITIGNKILNSDLDIDFKDCEKTRFTYLGYDDAYGSVNEKNYIPKNLIPTISRRLDLNGIIVNFDIDVDNTETVYSYKCEFENIQICADELCVSYSNLSNLNIGKINKLNICECTNVQENINARNVVLTSINIDKLFIENCETVYINDCNIKELYINKESSKYVNPSVNIKSGAIGKIYVLDSEVSITSTDLKLDIKEMLINNKELLLTECYVPDEERFKNLIDYSYLEQLAFYDDKFNKVHEHYKITDLEYYNIIFNYYFKLERIDILKALDFKVLSEDNKRKLESLIGVQKFDL